MLKKFLICMFTALAVRGMVSVSASAESGDRVEINDYGRIALISGDASDNGITTLRLSLDVQPEKDADVSFVFSDDSMQIAEYRYNPETNKMNVYISGTDKLFTDDTFEMGSVVTTDEEGNNVPFKVSVNENSLEYVSGNQLTESDSPESPEILVTSFEKMIGIDTQNQSSDLNLETFIPSSYMVVIPDNEIDIREPSEMSVSAKNVMIADNEVLDISVQSTNGWKLADQKSGSKATLAYKLTPAGATALKGSEPVSLISVNAGDCPDRTVTRILTAEVTGKPEVSGIYKDILVFTVSVNKTQQFR